MIGAMVLAAGRGERMRPLSDLMPKPALPLPGGPVVAWPLRLAAVNSGRPVVVNTWHLAEQMEEALGQVPEAETVVSRESRLMGTAGGLALAHQRGLLEGDEILVLNGDVILNLDLRPLLERFQQSDDLITLALLPHLDPGTWSRVTLDNEGRVRGFAPPGAPAPGEVPYLYPGVMLIARKVIASLPVTAGDTMQLLWRPTLQQRRLGGAVVAGHWREAGRPQAYLDAALALLAGSTYIADGAEVAAEVTLGTALIGPGSRIESGAVVAESVVSHGVTVGQGARVIGSVLLGGIRVAPNEVVTGQFRAA